MHCMLAHPNSERIFTPSLIQTRLNQIFFKCHENLRVNSVQVVPPTFNSKNHSILKTYIYKFAIPKGHIFQTSEPCLSDHESEMDAVECHEEGEVESLSQKSNKIPYQTRANNQRKLENNLFRRLYKYPIPLWLTDFVYYYPYPDFDIREVTETLNYFKGSHDFVTFMSPSGRGVIYVKTHEDAKAMEKQLRDRSLVSKDCDIDNSGVSDRVIPTVRKICEASLTRVSSDSFTDSPGTFNYFNENYHFDKFDYFYFTFKGKGFLYHQIRKMVGALLTVGVNKINKNDVQFMLDNPDINNWSPKILMAPAHGLYLENVEFDHLELQFPSDKPMIKYAEDGLILP